MEIDTGRRPEPPQGRKQDPARSEAILAATRELLLERGYDRFTVQDVADRAVAGVGAIYRRWPNKESLVAEAIRTGGELSYDRSDDPVSDLTNLVEKRAALAISHPDFVPGVVSAMRTSPQINEAMQQVHTTTAYREILARLIGADHPHLEVLAELAPAIIVHRTIFGGRVDPEAFAEDVLKLIRSLAETSRP
ncbi:MAG: TetR/AcrR family transcriptional regulator [Acidimicrobiales bacterium]